MIRTFSAIICKQESEYT